MTEKTLPLSERLVVASARGMSRRRLFRNVGGAALGAALTTAYVGTRPEVVTAQSCDIPRLRCGSHAISPICTTAQCNGASCNYPRFDTEWRNYDGFVCGGSGAVNCWTNCYGGRKYKCCDCARTGASCGQTVTGCWLGTWRACTCVGDIGGC